MTRRSRSIRLSRVARWLGLASLVVTASCGGGASRPLPTGGCDPGDPTYTGQATYYAATGAGNCSFPASPNDLLVAAMNQADYEGSAACGACVAIDGPSGSVTVRIVDRCPECPAGNLDLSPEAFQQISPLDAGRVPITWRYVACSPSGPVVYHFKDHSNQWWTAVQIRNARFAIASVEYLGTDGQYHPIPRVDYNYFVASHGLGPGPYSFRVTDVEGNVLEDSNIPLVVDGDVAGAAQFPACPASTP